MTRTPRIRMFRTLASGLALGLALVLGGCDAGETTKPGEGQGKGDAGSAGEEGEAAGGLAYTLPAEGFSLVGTIQLNFEATAPEGQGSAVIEARTQLEATPQGDKLLVHGKVLELIKYEGKGNLDPEFIKKEAEANGAGSLDVLESLRTAERWMVMDRKGETDEEATRALPQNQHSEDEPPRFDVGLFNLFVFPDLPKYDLEVGKKVTVPTYEDEADLGNGNVLPVEIDETWELKKQEGEVAEILATSATGGATELSGPQGSGFLSIANESNVTIRFNTESKMFEGFGGYVQSEYDFDGGGQSFQFSTINEMKVSYAPGTAEPAPSPAPESAEGAPAGAPAEDAPAEDTPAEGEG